MRACDVARTPLGTSVIDICDSCDALWFDAFESVRLTRAATIALFREVNTAPSPRRHAMPGRMPCPRCSLALVETHDLQHATRFSYWRCPRGHGRLTPFVQFLREKDYIRPLSRVEIEELKVYLRAVRCSGCGASIELAKDMVCPYCRTAIEARSVLRG